MHFQRLGGFIIRFGVYFKILQVRKSGNLGRNSDRRLTPPFHAEIPDVLSVFLDFLLHGRS